jgi:hypothetical protein
MACDIASLLGCSAPTIGRPAVSPRTTRCQPLACADSASRREEPVLRHADLVGLEDNPFDWRVTKNGQVLVSRGGRVVTTVRGGAAARLIGLLERADEAQAQQLLARATGHYKHGNERHA